MLLFQLSFNFKLWTDLRAKAETCIVSGCAISNLLFCLGLATHPLTGQVQFFGVLSLAGQCSIPCTLLYICGRAARTGLGSPSMLCYLFVLPFWAYFRGVFSWRLVRLLVCHSEMPFSLRGACFLSLHGSVDCSAPFTAHILCGLICWLYLAGFCSFPGVGCLPYWWILWAIHRFSAIWVFLNLLLTRWAHWVEGPESGMSWLRFGMLRGPMAARFAQGPRLD